MDDKRIRVLLIEDDPDDVLLLKEALAEALDIQLQVTHADRLATGLEKLAEGGIDMVLLDLNLPDSRGLDTLAAWRAQAPDVPVVVLSGLADETVAMEAIQQGAQDYLVKGRTDGQTLVRILRYATERHQLMQSLRASEARLRHLIQQNPDGVLVVDQQGLVRYLNPAAEALFGRQAEEMIGAAFGFPIVAGETTELDIVRGPGERAVAEMRVTEIEWEEKPAYLIALRDITRRKRMEAALRRRAEELAALHETALDIATLHDLPTRLQIIIQRVVQLLDASGGEVGLYDETTGDLLIAASHNMGQDYTGTRMALGEGAMGRAAQTREPLIVEDYPAWEGRSSQYADGLWHGVMAVPLVFRDRLIGAIGVVDADPARRFSETDLRILELFAQQAAVAVENARLLAENARRLETLDALYEAAQHLAERLDLQELAATIVRDSVEIFGLKLAWLGRAEPDGRVSVLSHYPLENAYPRKVAVRWDEAPEGQGPTGRAIRSGAPVVAENLTADPHFAPWRQAIRNEGFSTSAAFPLVSRGHTFGALNLYSEQPGFFTPERVDMLQTYAHQAAAALEKARQREELLKLRSAVEQAEDITFITDREGRIEYVNQAFERITGYSKEEAVGETPRILNSGLTPSEYFQRMWNTILAGKVFRGENINRKKNGEIFYYEQTVTPLTNVEGKITHFVSTGRDITERKQAEAALRRHAEETKVADQIFQSLNASPQVSEAFPAVAAGLRAITHCERASIALLDEGGETLTMFALDQPRPELPQGVTVNLADTSAADDVLAARPHLTPDLAAEAEWPAERALYEAGYRSRLNLPLAVGEKILGVLNLAWNEPEGYDLEQLPLLKQIASAVASALERTRLLQAEQQRRREVEHLYQLSSDLVATDDVETIFDSVVHHVVDAAHVTFCRLVTLEEDGAFVCRSAHPVRALDRDLGVGQPEPQELWLLYRRALGQNEPWVLHPDYPDLSEEERQALFLDRVHSLSLAPLRVGGEAIGLLILGETRHPERESFSTAKLRLLTAIDEQAASAIHRAMLHHQTERRMRWLTALRNIDLAITSSLDPRVVLNVLLDQVVTQLEIHAAAVLLLNPYNQTLEYAAGRGFRTNAIRRTRQRVGEGHAGRAALERKVVHIPDLAATDEFLRTSLLAGEDFVAYYAAPLISKGQVKGVLELFHRTPHVANGEWLEFLETLAGQAAIAIDNAELFDQLHRSNMELTLAYDETLEGWARALELRDDETEGHSRRVTEMTMQLARAMGLSEAELVHVRRGALLHDIGKVGIPDNILLKPGKLSDEEWEVMRRHPVYAYEMLAPIAYLQPALDIPYCHHERWDGSGYPRGLKGEEIPLAARIFAVVDVWDALRSDRPYRKGWPAEKVEEYLREQAGKTLDPQVVEMFLRLIPEFESRT